MLFLFFTQVFQAIPGHAIDCWEPCFGPDHRNGALNDEYLEVSGSDWGSCFKSLPNAIIVSDTWNDWEYKSCCSDFGWNRNRSTQWNCIDVGFFCAFRSFARKSNHHSHSFRLFFCQTLTFMQQDQTLDIQLRLAQILSFTMSNTLGTNPLFFTKFDGTRAW